MIVRTSSVLAFACYDSSCRPPTSGGTGGSSKGGAAGGGGGIPSRADREAVESAATAKASADLNARGWTEEGRDIQVKRTGYTQPDGSHGVQLKARVDTQDGYVDVIATSYQGKPGMEFSAPKVTTYHADKYRDEVDFPSMQSVTRAAEVGATLISHVKIATAKLSPAPKAPAAPAKRKKRRSAPRADVAGGAKPPSGYNSWTEYRTKKAAGRAAEVKIASRTRRPNSPYGDFEP